MSDHHQVLGQVVLGYAPVVDRQRAVIATRLTIFPERRDAPPDARALIDALAGAFPEAGEGLNITLRSLDGSAPAGPALKATPLLLNIANEALLDAVLSLPPPPQVTVEVPAFMASNPARLGQLQALQANGVSLAIKGRPVTELPRELLPCFGLALVEVSEERRTSAAPQSAARTIATVSTGARTTAEVEAAFAAGAQAVAGWPLDEPVPGVKGGLPPDLRGIVELMNRVDREEPAEKMEPVLKADPTLAFRLLRYINSAAFGLRVEVTSFKHALMLLGYTRLKRWLALLLASASKDPTQRPLMHLAVRRGLLMEELARASGDDEMRNEMFICGVFSLLDRLMRQPFDELLKNVPVPEQVQSTLLGNGPFVPALDLVRALEQSSLADIRDNSERMLTSSAEVNRALLAALTSARQLS